MREAGRNARAMHADKGASRLIEAAFAIAVFAILLVPSVGMFWFATDSTTENRELAAFPAISSDDGVPNVSFLSELGTYFEDHFAMRNQMVTANARLRALFGVSASDQVVLGTDGWLYYAGTLPDYQRTAPLSDKALANIAHNMRMAQDYVEAHGAHFAFTVAPNKNTLFSEHMPYYQLAGVGESNAERLKGHLEAEGVHYIDLFDIISQDEEARYLKTDSHWDNATALRAGNKLLTAVGRNPVDLEEHGKFIREGAAGDIAAMLYPMGVMPEENVFYEGVNDGPGMTGSTWQYTIGSSFEDDYILTEQVVDGANVGDAESQHSLLVFRDSFGNALLPFWAYANPSVVFSKLVPYNLPVMVEVGADAVVIERVERHLDYLAEYAPIMPSPIIRSFSLDDFAGAQSLNATVSAHVDGPYLVINGTVDPTTCSEASRLYVVVDDAQGSSRCYEPFWVSTAGEDGKISSDYGYQIFVSAGSGSMEGVKVHICAVDGENRMYAKSFEDIIIDR